MPNLPRWVPLLVGAMVFVFGIYRLHLGFRSKEAAEEAKKQGGLYGLGRRTHVVFGCIFVIAGLMLLLPVLGVRLPWP